MAGVLLDAAYLDSGMRKRQEADRKAESEKLALERDQMAMNEAKRLEGVNTEVRTASAQAYEDARRAAESANVAIRERNQPEEIPLVEGGSAWRNRITGETTTDKAKAFGVVPEKTVEGIFEKEYASKIRDVYARNGMPEKVAQFDDWMQSRTGKRYLQEAHKGLQSIAMGDKNGGLRVLQDLYNSQVRDGRYGQYEDMGNGTTKLTVFDSATGKSSSQIIPDSELGTRAAQFLSPEFLAQHVLATNQKQGVIAAQFNADVAKARLEYALKGDLKAQEVALEARAAIMKQFSQAQLDMMIGKDTKVYMDQMGQNVFLHVPGEPLKKVGRDGKLTAVTDAEARSAQAGAMRGWSLAEHLGKVGLSQQGVAPPSSAPSEASAPTPTAAPTIDDATMKRVADRLSSFKGDPTKFESAKAELLERLGQAGLDKILALAGVSSAQASGVRPAAAAPSPAPKPAPKPAAPKPAAPGVKAPSESQVIQQMIAINRAARGAMANLDANATQEQRAEVANANLELERQKKALLELLPKSRRAAVEEYVSKQQ